MTEQETQVAPASPGKAAAIGGYLLETRTEMEKVNWPPQEELVKATKAVLIGAGWAGLTVSMLRRSLRIMARSAS